MVKISIDNLTCEIKIGMEKIYKLLGDILYSQGEWENSLNMYRLSHEQGASMEFFMGRCLYKMHNYKEASILFKEICEKQFNEIYVVWMLRCYYRMELWEKVVFQANQLDIECLIKNNIHIMCVEAFLKNGDLVNAENIIKYCDTDKLSLHKAELYFRQGKYKDCLEIYDILRNKENKQIDMLKYAESLYKCDQSIDFNLFYNISYKDNNKDEMTITMHPFTNKFLFYKLKFKTDVLFLGQKTLAHYYVLFVEEIISEICNYINKKKYKKIYIVGSSKSAFGALLYSFMLSKKITIPIFVTVFSPQTNILPQNKRLINLVSLSYFHKFSKEYTFLCHYLNIYGDLIKWARCDNKLHIICIVGEKSVIDWNEAVYLGDYMEIINIEGFPYHGAYGVLFTRDEDLEKAYKASYLPVSEDDKFFSKENITLEEYVSIHNKYKHIRWQWLPMLESMDL